ncbi:hypothetical protein HN446_03370 [bacterium]|jgi:hypothetical protein|nr:hypothetical protein [bacterium]
MRIFVLFVTFLFFHSPVLSESYLKEKPKNKKISAAKLKEQIAQSYADIQAEIGRVLQTSGRLIEKVVEDVQDIVDGTKGSFFSEAKVVKLKLYQEEISRLHQDINEYHNKISDGLRAIENKDSQ